MNPEETGESYKGEKLPMNLKSKHVGAYEISDVPKVFFLQAGEFLNMFPNATLSSLALDITP